MLRPRPRPLRSGSAAGAFRSLTRADQGAFPRDLSSIARVTASNARPWSCFAAQGKLASKRPSNQRLAAPKSRSFSTSLSRPRDHHFDTLKFVQRLKHDGFTEEQAVAMMKVLSDVIEER